MTVHRPVDAFAHQMLAAADRIAQAHRTEDLTVIEREIAAALAIPAPPGGPDPVRTLIGALAVQIDTGVPWRERFAWTLDVAAVAPVEPLRPSSGGFAGSGGWGGTWKVPA